MSTVEPITPDELALDLGMLQSDDVRAVVESIVDLHDEEIPAEIAGEVRAVLDPHGERTAPAALYWPGSVEDPQPGSPTGGEGFYPDN